MSIFTLSHLLERCPPGYVSRPNNYYPGPGKTHAKRHSERRDIRIAFKIRQPIFQNLNLYQLATSTRLFKVRQAELDTALFGDR
jgi:hypothetical protein